MNIIKIIILYVLQGINTEDGLNDVRVTLENALRLIKGLPCYAAEDAIKILFTEDIEDAE